MTQQDSFSLEHYRERREATMVLARRLFVAQFPTEDFDAALWYLDALVYRRPSGSLRRLPFTRYKMPDALLPTPYLEVIKSWIVLDGQAVADRYLKLQTARHLWEVILRRRQGREEAFQWETLTLEDLAQTELHMLTVATQSTAYHMATYLKALTNFLEARGICPPLHFFPQILRPVRKHLRVSSDQSGQEARLPTPKALEGLIEIYRVHAKAPPDRLRICALALLLVSGLRIGELLTLPLACEIEEMHRGAMRYGLRYYREKSKGGEQMLAIRWLTSTGAELARTVLQEIRSITAPFREQALQLERHPEKIIIPGFSGEDHMTPKQVTQTIGMKSISGLTVILAKLPRHENDHGLYYLAHEVEAYLRAERKALWTLDLRNGTYQLLSETLLIAPRYFFSFTMGTSPLLIEPVTYLHIRQFLVSWDERESAFERFSICEEDGSFCKMTTHQFRHWLNDIADKGGLPVDVQTRWMGRDNPRDTHAYHHATVEERLRWVKEGIREDKLGGTMANVFFQLPPDERDLFLEGQIQAVHVTALGLCLHDFSMDPCPYHLNCLRGCRDYLRVKGNQRERYNLIQIRTRTEQARALAEEEARKQKLSIADPWKRHYEETLAGVNAALAIDNDGEGEEGEMISPFVQQPSRFQAL